MECGKCLCCKFTSEAREFPLHLTNGRAHLLKRFMPLQALCQASFLLHPVWIMSCQHIRNASWLPWQPRAFCAWQKVQGPAASWSGSVAPSVLPSLLQDEAMKTLLLALLGVASLLQLTLSLRIGAFNIRAFGDKKLSNQTISSSIVRVSPSDCTGETRLWQPGPSSPRAHPWPRSSFPWAEVPAASELACPTQPDRSLSPC